MAPAQLICIQLKRLHRLVRYLPGSLSVLDIGGIVFPYGNVFDIFQRPFLY